MSGGDGCLLPNCGNLVLRLTCCQWGLGVSGGPARRIQENPAMLEGPRADRHGSDDPAYWCRGEAPQLAEGDFTRVSESAGLRRRP